LLKKHRKTLGGYFSAAPCKVYATVFTLENRFVFAIGSQTLDLGTVGPPKRQLSFLS